MRITSVAPLRVVSKSGESTAILIASAALSSPLPYPMPICAMPFSFMTVCTSAKSRLMTDGTLIRSVIPCTDCCNTSSAFLSASGMVVRRSTISSSLSFGMTIKVSTCSLSFSIPISAFVIRVRASNLNGFVTTPTVRIPISFAIAATIGAAPVPVPPPIPHVTNTMSAPFSDSFISSELSSAAFSPTSGFAPAPSPFVSFSPICKSFGALQSCNACLSVLTPINSTPVIVSSIIRFTALLPAPPTPTTIILAAASVSFDLISSKFPSSFIIPIKFHLTYHIIFWAINQPIFYFSFSLSYFPFSKVTLFRSAV